MVGSRDDGEACIGQRLPNIGHHAQRVQHLVVLADPKANGLVKTACLPSRGPRGECVCHIDGVESHYAGSPVQNRYR